MFDKELAVKLDKHLREKLDIIYEFDFNGLLLLRGGAIKSVIMDTEIKDYDFVLHTFEGENIMEFINKYDVEFIEKNKYEYKFLYNGVQVGINPTDDLSNSTLNTDFLFFDIHRKQFIPFGIKQAITKRQVIVYEYLGYPRYEKRINLKERIQVAKNFIQFMNKDNKRVRVIRKDKRYRRMLLGFIKNPSKIKKLFRR